MVPSLTPSPQLMFWKRGGAYKTDTDERKLLKGTRKRGSCGEINFSPNSSCGVFECAWL